MHETPAGLSLRKTRRTCILDAKKSRGMRALATIVHWEAGHEAGHPEADERQARATATIAVLQNGPLQCWYLRRLRTRGVPG